MAWMAIACKVVTWGTVAGQLLTILIFGAILAYLVERLARDL